MARIHSIQTSFNLGEITPKMYGRVDLAKYGSSLATMYNMLPSPYGGAFRRPGTQFVAEALDSTKNIRLIPFIFSESQTYMLEFSDQTLRFYKDKGLVVGSIGSIADPTLPADSDYTDVSTGTGSLTVTSGSLEFTTSTTSTNEARASYHIENPGQGTYTIALSTDTTTIEVRAGTTDGGTDLLTGTNLGTGADTVTFNLTTSPADLYIQFRQTSVATNTVSDVEISLSTGFSVTNTTLNWTDTSSGGGVANIFTPTQNFQLATANAGESAEVTFTRSSPAVGEYTYTATNIVDSAGGTFVFSAYSTNIPTKYYDEATIVNTGWGNPSTFTFTVPAGADDLIIKVELQGTASAGQRTVFNPYLEVSGASSTTVTNPSTGSPTGGGGSQEILDSVYILDTPYSHTELDEIRYVQSADVMYLVHPNHPPYQLSRFADAQWEISEIEFYDGPYLDIQQTNEGAVLVDNPDITMTPSGITGSITMTASVAVFQPTDVGRFIRYKSGPDFSDETTYTGNGTQTYFDIPFFPRGEDDIQVEKATANGQRTVQTLTTHYTVSNGQVIMTSAPSSSELIIINRANAGSGEWGYGIITAVGSSTSATVTVENELAGTNASLDWQLGAFGETAGYPSQITIHDQRLILAGTSSQPQTFWGSETFDFFNFSPDNVFNKGDVDDSTSYNFTIASQEVESIRWIASSTALIFGCSASVYSVSGGQSGITSDSINIKKESSTGSLAHIPARTDSEVLFLKKLGRELSRISYSFEADGYTAKNLSLFSEHFGTESQFQQIAYQEVPNRVVWVRRANGSLVSCTYLPEQDVNGWAEHQFGGTDAVVKNIGVLPTTSEDQLYLVIQRTINGNTVKHIEVMANEFNQMNKEDATFLDSYLTYTGTAVTKISGLVHLEGEMVSVLVNGATHPDLEVIGGIITLKVPATTLIVGLPYTSKIETNPVEAGTPFGTSQATVQRVIEAGIRFSESLNVLYGYQADKTDRLIFRTTSTPMGSSPALFSGIKTVKFPHGQELGSKIYLEQDLPLPLTVLSVILKVEITER